MEKLLFTGGTGFLGRNIKPILDERYEVTTIGISDADMIKAIWQLELYERKANRLLYKILEERSRNWWD